MLKVELVPKDYKDPEDHRVLKGLKVLKGP